MKKIEQLLATGTCFIVDPSACMQHAQTIKLYKRKVVFHSWNKQPSHIQLAFKVAFISICHQINWDFLQSSLAHNLLQNNEKIIDTLSASTSTTIENWLGDYPKKERIRAKERSSILRNVAHVFSQDFHNDLEYFYRCCTEAKLGNGEFHRLMDKFDGYRSDPLKKKTNVLTHDLIKEGIVNFIDEQNIEPAIDYHIMRLYLRTGRVIPSDESLFRFLEGAPNPRGSLIRQLRNAVNEAEKLTAYYSGLNVADVNYIEWQVGRSICHNKLPECKKTNSEIVIEDDIAVLFTGKCPYQGTCLSYNQFPRFLDFEEPLYASKDY